MNPLNDNPDIWIEMFQRTMDRGIVSHPRGLEIRELMNFSQHLSLESPFMAFEGRNINVDYFKKEMLWKLKGDKFDTSIEEHAKMWMSVKNTDGSFNSNYGQYWFGQQLGLHKAFNELISDKDSRRAIIPMLSDNHIGHGVTDTVCTESCGFFIRNNALHMIVHMRSSDQIFGLGTDIPTFSFLYRLMFAMLRGTSYPDLIQENGSLEITAMSSHIYERHFGMIEAIINSYESDGVTGNEAQFTNIKMPWANTNEAFKLAASRGHVDADWGELSSWLIDINSTN